MARNFGISISGLNGRGQFFTPLRRAGRAGAGGRGRGWALGGDEFTVILTEVPGELEVERVTQKMIETLALPYSFDGQLVRVSASVGIAIYPVPCDTIERLLQGADEAMYQAKAAGKNRYAIVNPLSPPSQ